MENIDYISAKSNKTSTFAWLLVALLWVTALLNYLDRQVIFSILPLLKTELNIPEQQLGFLGGAFLWVYGLASPISGYIADRFGRIRVIIISLLVWSIVTWLTGHAQNMTQLIIIRALMGISEAFYIPAALALITEYHSKGRLSLATGIHTSGIYAGIILGGAGGGWIGQTYGWRSAFITFGVIGIVYTVIIYFVLRSKPSQSEISAKQPNILSSFRELLIIPGYKTMIFGFIAFSLANWAIYTWLPYYLTERFNMKLSAAGFSATFYIQAASIAGILVGGYIADKWSQTSSRGRILTQCIGIAIAAPCLFIAGYTSISIILIVALIVFGIGRGFYDCNTMPALSQIAPPHLRSTGYGIFNMAGTLSGGFIAVIAGYLKQVIGLGGVFQLAAIMLFAAYILLYRSKKHIPVSV